MKVAETPGASGRKKRSAPKKGRPRTKPPAKKKPTEKELQAKAAKQGRKFSAKVPEIAHINPEEVMRLAKHHCSAEDIAAEFKVSLQVLNHHFADELKQGRAMSRNKLRELQWKSAEALNPTTLIWLGKVLLGQRDNASAGDEHFNQLPEMVRAMVANTRQGARPTTDRRMDELAGTVQ